MDLTRLPSICLLFVVFLCSPARSQETSRLWPGELNGDDERDMRQLAREMGVDEPLRIVLSNPLFDHHVRMTVEGPGSVVGRAVLSRRVGIMLLGAGDDALSKEPGRRRVGRWISSGEPERVTRWRIYDGDWFTDVSLSSEEDYDNAALIVHAIRGGTMVNRQPIRDENGVLAQPPIPAVTLPRDGAIIRERPWPITNPSRNEYSVLLWALAVSGENLMVRVVGGQVECLGVSRWDS